MDEYQLEIQDIRRTLLRLKAEKAAEELIEEYEAELRNLVALYQAATETLEQGRREPRLRDALAELGFGEWTLTNVYEIGRASCRERVWMAVVAATVPARR